LKADTSRLFPKLPLYAGVLITAADVLIVLAFFRSDAGRRGMLFFELLIVTLVSIAAKKGTLLEFPLTS
jgi:Mn2+/Fe2+ NRAMP family transporter